MSRKKKSLTVEKVILGVLLGLAAVASIVSGAVDVVMLVVRLMGTRI